MTPTNTPNDNLDTLLTMEEVMAVVKLGKTATREALKAPGAPAPVVFNARCHRWWASEVYAWLRQLQVPTSPVAVSIAASAAAAPPARRAVAGRPRKHTV